MDSGAALSKANAPFELETRYICNIAAEDWPYLAPPNGWLLSRAGWRHRSKKLFAVGLLGGVGGYSATSLHA